MLHERPQRMSVNYASYERIGEKVGEAAYREGRSYDFVVGHLFGAAKQRRIPLAVFSDFSTGVRNGYIQAKRNDTRAE